MTETIDNLLAELAQVVTDKEHIITNALRVYAEHMSEAAEQARTAYAATQADPEVKAAQDRTIVHSEGLRMSADMFDDSAKRARDVAASIDDVLERIAEADY